jgi:hypothetical protein
MECIMHKLSTRIALLAVVGSMTAITPVLAAPQSHGPGTPGGIDCSLAQNAKNPFCLQGPGHGRSKSRPGGDSSNHQGDNNGPGSSNASSAPPSANNDNNDTNNDHRGPPNGQNNGDYHSPGHSNNDNNGGMDRGPRPGSFDFSRHDRDQFHQRFHGFNFGFFPAPGFSIHIGTSVPRSYGLRPVPSGIYRYYPWFRGYLFFVTRGGDIVIVSPRSHRIVGII